MADEIEDDLDTCPEPTLMSPPVLWPVHERHPRWFTPKEAANYIRVTEKTLETWRSKRNGPAWLERPRVIRYDVNDLDPFLAYGRAAQDGRASVWNRKTSAAFPRDANPPFLRNWSRFRRLEDRPQ